MSDSVQPHRRQPTRVLCPWDSSGTNTGVGCHFLLQCMHACMLSSFSRVQLCATLWTAALQAPLSMGFSRQKPWSGLPFLSPVRTTNLGSLTGPPLWTQPSTKERINKNITGQNENLKSSWRLEYICLHIVYLLQTADNSIYWFLRCAELALSQYESNDN